MRKQAFDKLLKPESPGEILNKSNFSPIRSFFKKSLYNIR